MPEEAFPLEKAAGILADLSTTTGSSSSSDGRRSQKRCPLGTWEAESEPHPSLAAYWGSLADAGRDSRPPLVQCVTNTVSMDLMANVLLASRCSPAMVSDASESAEFAARRASALLVNVGTLSPAALAGARAAAEAANAAGKPWVLDAVAMGGTAARSAAIVALVRELKPTVIKANGSEMIALAKALRLESGAESGATAPDAAAPRGVDCAPGVTPGAKAFAAAAVARGCRCVAVVTGETDFVFWPPYETTDTEASGARKKTLRCLAVESGSGLYQPAVTAQGCALGALIAGVLGLFFDDVVAAGRKVAPFSFESVAAAAAAAAGAFGAAAVVAERAPTTKGPGSFRAAFIDALWNLTADDVDELGRVSCRQVMFF